MDDKGMYTFNFSDALALMKQGVKMLRDGWEKEDIFCYYVPKGQYGGPNGSKETYGPLLVLHTKLGFTIPWHPESDDLLSNDWCIYAGYEDVKKQQFKETQEEE